MRIRFKKPDPNKPSLLPAGMTKPQRKPAAVSKTPTKRTYDVLDEAFDYFNKQLFGGRLQECLITVRKHGVAHGYYSAERFTALDGSEQRRDEIALNIKDFERGPKPTMATLVHEMVHQEQKHFGQPSRSGYHNREWADLMERIGLMPSDTGAPSGRRTGQRMTHYIVPGGAFERAYNAREFVLPYSDRKTETEATRKKRKVTYTCVNCGSKSTGRPNMKLHCDCENDCNMAVMTPTGGPDGLPVRDR